MTPSSAESHERAATTAKVRSASTLDGGVELVDRIPIGSSRNQLPVVVLSLGGSSDPDCAVPDLKPGDRLEILAEVEVTRDLTPDELTANAKTGGKATGKPYDFAPEVTATLLLSSAPTAKATGTKALVIGKPQVLKVSHDSHHAVFVFGGIADEAFLDIPAKGLPWSGPSYVNLVLSASNKAAQAGQVLIVGQNNFDGVPTRKMASIAVLRRRPAAQTDPAAVPKPAMKVTSLAISSDQPKVVYSVPLTNLKANEQLRVRGLLDATVSGSVRGRLKTEVFLADSQAQLEPLGKSYAASISSGKGKLTRPNGFNCLPGQTTHFRKAGTIHITQDAAKTVYLNVACTPGNPTKTPNPGSIRLLSSGDLDVVRFGSGRCG